MKKIHTVSGDIDPQELGMTYSHEHLIFCPAEPIRSQDPDLCLDSVETAIREVRAFKQAGGGGLVEMSTVDLGRSPLELRQIADACGVHVVAATGFNKGKFCESMVAGQSVEQLAARMVADLTQGMDSTSVRAGLIKASSSRDQMTPGEKKVFQAAILAHRETGAPVSTHTEGGTLAPAQVELLVSGGVDPAHILIGHLDRKLEWDYILSVARSGVFLGFDQICKEKYYPDSLRIDFIRRLIEAGYGDRIVLSGDLARKSYWPSSGFGSGPGLTYILWRFVPWMIESGIPEAAVRRILLNNPAAIFAWE
jgi:5-phospho-D-xylono-1,4-lactonase